MPSPLPFPRSALRPSRSRSFPERPQRLLGAGLALLALMGLGEAAQRSQRVERKHKNVILIVLDDLGTDKLAFYDETPPDCPAGPCLPPSGCVATPTGCVAEYPPTPSLAALREQGILFTRAYATPVCSSTRAYLQTGRYGFRTGVGRATNTVTIPGDFELSSSEVFLAELLRGGFGPSNTARVGLPYVCGAFGKWHLSTTLAADRGHAVENGYDRFRGTMGNLGNFFRYDWVSHEAGSAPSAVKIDGSQTVPAFGTDTWHASVTTREALAWIRAQRNSFFAYVCYSPPHTPIQVPPEALLSDETRCALACEGLAPGDFLSPQGDPPELVKLVHRALIEAVDAEIGNLLAGLEPAQRADTMILVIGDNGTAGFVVDDPPHDALHAKGDVYELGVRVPLIVSGPLVAGPIPSGGWQSDALVSAVDLYLTIAEITGADESRVVPPGWLDSISFLPSVRDPLYPGDRTLVFAQTFSPNGVFGVPPPSCYDSNDRSLSDGVYKYIRRQVGLLGSPCGTPLYGEELYDLSLDPEETSERIGAGLTPAETAALNALRARMDALSGH